MRSSSPPRRSWWPLTLHRTHRGALWASGAAQAAQFVRIILRFAVSYWGLRGGFDDLKNPICHGLDADARRPIDCSEALTVQGTRHRLLLNRLFDLSARLHLTKAKVGMDGYVGRQLQGLADTRLEMRRYLCRLSVLGRWASFLPSDEKTYVNELVTTCRYGNSSRATPRPTASPVQLPERDQRSASVPMPPLLMRLINNLW